MSGLTSPARRTRAPRRHLHRTLTTVLTFVALLLGSAAFGPVGAQDIESAQAEADRLAAELGTARERLIELAEQHNRAIADLDAAQAQVDANQTSLQEHEQALQVAQKQLQDYAVAAYVSGGSLRDLDGFFGADSTTADRRLNYLEAAAGDEQAVFDQLAAAHQQLDRQREQLDQAERVAAAQMERVEQARREATELEATTATLLEQANGRLADLVAEAEARRAAEEAAAAEAARAEAEAAAAQAARAAAAAQPATLGAASAPAPTPAPVAYTPPPGIRPEAAIALSAAMSQLGVPYVWGGSSPSQGFDCSGLMYWAYAQAGIRISRPADYQRDDAIRISYEDLQPGDLVFYGEPPSHVGMYIGNDEIINAPQTGELVSIKTMWYSRKPMTYGRIG
ncbi:MAG: NlpC/P60 family protein [Acidimicrobiia bacterium]